MKALAGKMLKQGVGNIDRFWTVLGSVDGHVVPSLFLQVPNVSCVFVFLTSQHYTTHTHTTRISLVFPFCFKSFSTRRHTHTHAHTRTSATDRDLGSGLSKSV